MSEINYRFEPLTEANVSQWFEVGQRCPYAPANVLDEALMRARLQEPGAELNILVHERSSGRPVAVLPGRLVEWSKGPLAFRVLESRFGGLMMVSEHLPRAEALKAFVFHSVIVQYYGRRCRIDYVDLHTPPKVALEYPGLLDKIVPFYACHIRVNSMLYARLADDTLDALRSTVRREITKGRQRLEECRLVRGADESALEHLRGLEIGKARELRINPLSPEQMTRMLRCSMHHTLIALADGHPIAGVVASCCNGVATLHYNASTSEGKKSFVNKALIFRCMEECRDRSAKYFVLGNGDEEEILLGRRAPAGSSNVPNVTFFKRSLSTDETAWYRFIYPLTKRGHAVTSLAQWQARVNGRHRGTTP